MKLCGWIYLVAKEIREYGASRTTRWLFWLTTALIAVAPFWGGVAMQAVVGFAAILWVIWLVYGSQMPSQ